MYCSESTFGKIGGIIKSAQDVHAKMALHVWISAHRQVAAVTST